jgi:nucleoside-diphosphate-sugar epimerase
VVHLAAVTAAPERERRQAKAVLDVNLGGLAAVLTACAALKVKRFIYVSSIAVFGPDTADGALLEEETPHDPRTLYALTKSTGEAVVARLGDLLDLDWTVARIGRVFGPFEHETGERDTMSQIYQVMRSASEGRPVRFARPCFKNWNYAKDVGEDLARLARAEGLALRTYNLGSPHRWSLEDWCERLAAVRPGFRFTIDEAAPSPEAEDRVIDLMGQRDGALLSWARFQAAFPTRASHDLDAAFDDYLRFLDLQAKS